MSHPFQAQPTIVAANPRNDDMPPAPDSIIGMGTNFLSRNFEKQSGDYDRRVAPLRAARQAFADQANRYTTTGNIAAAQLLGDWLSEWADKEALTHFFHPEIHQKKKQEIAASAELADKNDNISQFNLSLTLCAIANSYTQIRDALPEHQQRNIDQWLHNVQSTLVSYIPNNPQIGMLSIGETPAIVNEKAQQNHGYWRGTARMAVGAAIHNQDILEQGYQEVMVGIDTLANDPHHMFTTEVEKRGAKAVEYSFYAAVPLILAAEIGLKKGKDLYAKKSGILPRYIHEALLPILEGNDTHITQLISQRTAEQQQIALKGTNPHTIREAFKDGIAMEGDKTDIIAAIKQKGVTNETFLGKLEHSEPGKQMSPKMTNMPALAAYQQHIASTPTGQRLATALNQYMQTHSLSDPLSIKDAEAKYLSDTVGNPPTIVDLYAAEFGGAIALFNKETIITKPSAIIISPPHSPKRTGKTMDSNNTQSL